MAFQREKQNVSASELLQAFSNEEDIQLSQCTVTGVLDVNRLLQAEEKFETGKLAVRQEADRKILTFSQSVVFDKCIFEENTVFSAPWSNPDSVSVEFESDVIFNSSVFKGQVRFRNAVFMGVAGFDGCTFDGVVTFKNSCINKEAKFRTSLFNGYSLFGGAIFNGSVRFTNTHFVKGVNFSGAKFLGQLDFSGVYSSSRAVPMYDSVVFRKKSFGEDESFWRFVKQSAQDAGYYRLAGESFYSERCANLRRKLRGTDYDKISVGRKIVRGLFGVRLLPEIFFGKLLFGYGERPIRVLVASLIIIVACAFFYSVPGALIGRLESVEASFSQGLYFSTITFTTLGYGDLYPAAEGYCRALAMAEAAAGGCLMALFVVCLAKRFSRG